MNILYSPFNRNHERTIVDGQTQRRAYQVRLELHVGNQNQFYE